MDSSGKNSVFLFFGIFSFAIAFSILHFASPQVNAQVFLPPGLVFSLPNWKLQLPSGTENSPQEISAAQLPTYSSAHFHLDSTSNGMVFTARTDGVTTANSNYPRSELRERNATGTQNAAWSPADGKLHSLFIDQAILNTPTQTPTVVAGQIHDGSNDVMTIRYEGNGTGNSKGLHIRAYTGTGNQGRVDIPLNPNYQLGTRFTIKFEVAANNPNNTDVYYNGTKVYTLARNYGTTAYFKVGVYPQSSCIINSAEDCSSFGRVVVYDVSVCHDTQCTHGLTPACKADFDNSNFVDLSDYSLLVSNFFKNNSTWNNPKVDINDDGFVDITDYSRLIAVFFNSCNPQIPTPTASVGPTATTAPATLTPTTTPTATQQSNKIENCQIFPTDNPWNQDISQLPVHTNSANYIASMGMNTKLHPDFGGASVGESYGIPYVLVTNSQPMIPINFTAYGDESDPGPYPIPLNAPIEGGSNSDGDRHALAINTDTCMLYELYRAFPQSSSWNADSGAVFNLYSNALRPKYWTSADAAGLPVFPGLIRYEEVQKGSINHAIRFTASQTQRAFISPARHFASSSTDPNRPPMGLRVRLKASYNISGLTGQAKIIAEAMKKYGMILADNGSNWYFQGDVNAGWNDSQLNQLKNIPGSAFEVVNTGPLEY